MPAYAELRCHSNFSLLDGASSPEALAQRGQEIGLHALALTDHESLAGAIRFWTTARRYGVHPLIGAEVTLAEGAGIQSKLVVLAENQRGYANLCRLITAARLDAGGVQRIAYEPDTDAAPADWPGKITPQLTWEQLAQYSAGLICLTAFRNGPLALPLLRGDFDAAGQVVRRLTEIFGSDALFIELCRHSLPQDDLLIRRLCEAARCWRLPVVATNNVYYAMQAGSRLRDALIAIRCGMSLSEAQRAGLLPGHSKAYLAAPEEMALRFDERPDALANTVAIAERCQVSLDFSQQRLPSFIDACEQNPSPHLDALKAKHATEFALLYQLCHDNLQRRYPTLKPEQLTQLAHELSIIEKAGLAGYFLIVWDIIRFARSQGIRCQGRGSAANSIVAYLLGITSVDPLKHDLLFERFLSQDKYTMPDIDIDFAADRREEVIRYVYRSYGRSHTAMVCNVATYRARSALRDLGKALDFPPAVIERIAGQLESDAPRAAAEMLEAQVASDIQPGQMHPLLLLADLMRQIDGCPRHLSIHSGGMLITGTPLDEIVPLEPATMPGRVVCQWDKDSVEDAGLIKIDLLALRTLGVISEALAHITSVGDHAPDPETLDLADPALFAMLQKADTIGAFQVESRAQQQMLPRLRPERFEDMIIEIAIVRPGPIQGGAVHPYLRRRAGLEPVRYLHPCLEPVLGETLGVLLFQEQAIRTAVVAAGFLPGEADMLRRALSRTHNEEEMRAMKERFLQGARLQGIDETTASAIFAQLAGFAGYGFCKSHAASFALIAYQTLWLKRYHPAAFYCALLNQQPMGFYPIEVIVGDARRHGVNLLPPDVNRSDWKYRIEKRAETSKSESAQAARTGLYLRTGLSAVKGLGEAAWRSIEQARREAPFSSLSDFCLRARLDRNLVASLIRAGACDVFGERRQLLWQLGEIDNCPNDLRMETPATSVELPELSPLEQAGWEHELLGLAVNGQVMRHYRAALRSRGILSTWQVKESEAGQRIAVAGMMVVRQRPATAKGIVFISLEDESGLLDLVVKPETYDRLRGVLRSAALITARGVVQRSGRTISVLVEHATTLSDWNID